MATEPKRPSPMGIVLQLVVTGFLLWSLFGAAEAPSTTLKVLMWALLLCNLIYLGYVLLRPRD